MGRKIKRVGFGAQLSHGILFGVRHFEPDEVHEYYELHFYWGFVVLFITIQY